MDDGLLGGRLSSAIAESLEDLGFTWLYCVTRVPECVVSGG